MNYSHLFVITACLALFASGMTRKTTENGFLQRKTTKGFAILAMLPILIFVVAGPKRYWSDMYLYISNYKAMPDSFDGIAAYLRTKENSYFFYLFSALIKVASNGSVIAYQISLALLHCLPLVVLFRRYSDNYILSIYLIIATTIPLAWMLNGVRQFCAAVIIYSATPAILQKKHVKVILTVAIASLFHQSAIIMLPVIFVCYGKAWNPKTILMIAGAVVLAMVFSRSSGAADQFLENTGYSAEVYANDDGVHPLRVLVSAVPVLIAFFFRKQLAKEKSILVDFSINMSIVAMSLYLVGMTTSGILVGRLPIYMTLYNFILLPYELRRLFNASSYRIMVLITVALYGMYYMVQA